MKLFQRIALASVCVLSAQQSLAASYTKNDGSDARIAGCFDVYTSNDCTGTPTQSGEGAASGTNSYGEGRVSRRIGTSIPPRFVNEDVGVCGPGIGYVTIDCAAYCPMVGYLAGTLQQTTSTCGITNQNYCACTGPGLVFVHHATLTPSSTSNPVGTCVPVTVNLASVSNAALPAFQNTRVVLQSFSETGTYYTDSACTTQAGAVTLQSITIPAGTTYSTVYYRDPNAGTFDMQSVIFGLPTLKRVSMTFY